MTTCAEDFVLVNSGRRLTLVPPRRTDTLRARLHARSLDRRLANGTPAESDRLLALRAHQLVQSSSRRRLAARWRALAVATPQCAEIGQVADLLQSPAVSARAVGAAATLLPAAARGIAQRGGAGVDVAAAAARAALDVV